MTHLTKFALLIGIAFLFLIAVVITSTIGFVRAGQSKFFRADPRVRDAYVFLLLSLFIALLILIGLGLLLVTAKMSGLYHAVSSGTNDIELYKEKKEIESGVTSEYLLATALMISAIGTFIVAIFGFWSYIYLEDIMLEDPSAYHAALATGILGLIAAIFLILASSSYNNIVNARDKLARNINVKPIPVKPHVHTHEVVKHEIVKNRSQTKVVTHQAEHVVTET